MPGTRVPTEAQIRKMRKKRAVRVDLLNGITSRTELSVRHGMSVPTMSNYVREIMQEMRRQYEEDGFYESVGLQERMNVVYGKAVVGYERSRQDKEQVRTEYEQKKCPVCEGTGMYGEGDDEWCDRCEGVGKIVEEVVTRTVSGQAGDSSFLKVQLDCLREIGRLKGVYPTTKKEASVVNLNLTQIPGVDLSQVPNDKLLEALKLLQVDAKTVESDLDVIDVDVKEN